MQKLPGALRRKFNATFRESAVVMRSDLRAKPLDERQARRTMHA
jgi:hypothetical protein